MFCQSCGGEVKEGLAFCPHCGMRVSNTAAGARDGDPPEKKSKKGLVILLVAGINILVIAVLAIILWNSPALRYRMEMSQAMGLYEDRKYDKSAKAYLRALEIKEDSEEAKDGLIACYLSAAKECYEQKDYDETIAYCEQVFKIDSGNRDATEGYCDSYLSIAKEFYEEENYDSALDHYEIVLKKDKKNKDAKNGKIVCCMTMARAYKATDKYKAYQYYTKVLEEDPENQQALEEREQCGKLRVDGDMASWEETPDPEIPVLDSLGIPVERK